MKPSWAAATVVVALLVALGAGFWLWRGRGESAAPPAPESQPPLPPPADGAPAMSAEETWTGRLFLPSASDLLLPQEAPIVSAPSARARATAVVQALLAVTPVAPRVAVFPPGVRLGKLLLLEDGTVIVNLQSDPPGDPPASSSTLEQLRVYAIVNTIVRNVEEAKRVVLLWNGVQLPSFAGHVDTGRPLRLRPELEAP